MVAMDGYDLCGQVFSVPIVLGSTDSYCPFGILPKFQNYRIEIKMMMVVVVVVAITDMAICILGVLNTSSQQHCEVDTFPFSDDETEAS